MISKLCGSVSSVCEASLKGMYVASVGIRVLIIGRAVSLCDVSGLIEPGLSAFMSAAWTDPCCEVGGLRHRCNVAGVWGGVVLWPQGRSQKR